jgi:hypothetical protein
MRRRVERWLDRFTHRWELNPSGWIPRIKVPKGIYQQGTSYSGADDMFDENDDLGPGTPAYLPFFSFYELAWTWCWERRKEQDGPEANITDGGFWEEFWSFLHDVSMGIYDTTNWRPTDVSEEEWAETVRRRKRDRWQLKYMSRGRDGAST